ncbi:uncharacterized protein [Equus caballus]|uniref:uncharacterized protein n=1 Tax=Equus caballus TaxID=9796 RepID=UPI0038B2D2EB
MPRRRALGFFVEACGPGGDGGCRDPSCPAAHRRPPWKTSASPWVQQWSARFRRARFAWHGVRGQRAPTVGRRVNLLECRVPVFRGRGCERGSLRPISAGRKGRGEPPGESRSKPPARALGLAAGPEARDVGSPSKACRRPRREDLPVVCGAETRGNPARSVASGAPRARGSLRLVEVPCKARCRPPTEEDPSCPVTSAGARQSRRKCGPGCAPRPRTAQDGGISEQSLPSPKKRRPSCRLWSGDARESRKKRGFGCAPCPWLAEAGGSAVQSSLPPTDRRRPFVSRDERRCEAVAAEVWPGMRTTPSDGPGRWDLRAKLAVAQEEKTFLSFVERRREGIPQEAWLRVRPVPVAR